VTRETFHLVPEAAWSAQDPRRPYAAISLATEGFAHCTDGVEALGATFDRFYATDPRSFLALTLDLERLDVPWRYDDVGSPYPHIYGSIPRSAITVVNHVERDVEGRFSALRPA
jgi:uncharacterized protein (DUF952 family)